MADDTSYNSTVVYTCISGYIANSGAESFEATCSSDGTWIFKEGTSCVGGFTIDHTPCKPYLTRTLGKRISLPKLDTYSSTKNPIFIL